MGTETGDGPSFVKSLAVIALPLLVILLVAEVVLHGETALNNSNGLTGFDPLTLGFVSLLVLSVLFYELKKHGERTARLLMAGVTTSGMIAGLILLQAWFASASTGVGVFYLLAPPLAYAGFYFSFRDYTGSLSRRRAGILRAVSVTVLGAVLGAFLPVFFTIPFLVLLSILDPLLIESNILKRSVGMSALDSLTTATTLPLAGLDVGLGDLMAYSMLATSSIVNSGILAALATTALILTGVLLTLRIASSRHIVAGLSIPLWLGVLPSIILMLIPMI